MRNTTKFGSPKLHIYNSTYDFSKLAYISEINELAFKSTTVDSWGPESAGPACYRLKIEYRRWPAGVRRRRALRRRHRHHDDPQDIPHTLG